VHTLLLFIFGILILFARNFLLAMEAFAGALLAESSDIDNVVGESRLLGLCTDWEQCCAIMRIFEYSIVESRGCIFCGVTALPLETAFVTQEATQTTLLIPCCLRCVKNDDGK
jgi:hypothetical protein